MRNVQLDATAEEYLAGGATIFIRPNEYVEVAVSGDDVVRCLPLAASRSPACWPQGHAARSRASVIAKWPSVSNWERVAAT
jgi:hypothetical protein